MDEVDEEMEEHYRVMDELRRELDWWERNVPAHFRNARGDMFHLQRKNLELDNLTRAG